MKRLEAIPLDEIPGRGIGPGAVSAYETLFQEVLSLNGQAIPVELASTDAALRFACVCRATHSRARALGIRASQRGKVVYLYHGK